jgi:PAS domain S-box-containing protein
MVPEKPANTDLVYLLAAIVESSDDAIIGKTLDGIITSWNKGAEEIYGYKADEVIGKHISILVPSGYPDDIPQIIEKIRRGERVVHYKTKRARKDGTVIDVSLTVSPIKNREGRLLGASTIARDITERKKAEKLRHELAAIVESSDDAIIGKTLDGIITSWNKGAERIYGYKPEEVVGLPLAIIIPEDRRDELPRILSRVRRGEHIVHYETVRVRKDGKRLDVSVSVSPIKDETGKIIGASTITRDISLRKSYEVALRSSEEKYRRIVDIAEEGILVVDENGTATFANKKLAKLLGYDIVEIIGKNITAFMDEGDRGCIQWVKRRQLEGENVQFDFRFRRKDGSYIWTIVPTAPIFNEEQQYAGALYLISDITQHKGLEKALSISEARYRAIVDSQTELICRFRPDFSLTFANEAFCRYYRVKCEEITEHNYLEFIPKEYHGKFKERIALLNKDAPMVTVQSHFYAPGGESRWQQWVQKAVFDDAGRLIELQSVGRDMTEIKQTEQALEDAKSRAELYVDLMGHDINNMNQSALGFLELALDRIEKTGKLEEKEKLLLLKPVDALLNSAHLINNVRKLQRATSGEMKLMTVDMKEMLYKIAREYSHIPGRDITINYKPALEYRVKANELLEDVFANIVSNSIRHSEGPLTIDIIITHEHETGYYRISFEDNGPGIPDNLKEKIFLRFTQGNTKAEGKGLGLYLVKTLVEDFHGKVWVEDRVQGDYTKGSRFVVMLPVAG